MKIISSLLFLGSLMTAHAEIWERPPYKPDENHLPPETRVPMEAQEDRPEESREGKHQDIKKPDSSPDFEYIDDEIKEGEESNM